MGPPKLADRCLAWFCHEDLLEDLQGDLYEVYEERRRSKGKRIANIYYWWLVIRSFRMSALRPINIKNSTITMTGFNLKIAFRVLKKDAVNTLINLFGLTLGISCFLLLGLFVLQESSYDRFHTNRDNIYRVWLKETYDNGNEFFNAVTPPRFEQFYEENFPEVETAVQFNPGQYQVGRTEEKLADQVAIISPEFFDVFDFKLLYGNLEAPLANRESMVISQRHARKYFGDEDAVGQRLEVEIGDEVRSFIISAVFQDIPVYSSIQFDLGISNAINNEIFGERYRNAWFTVGPETYIVLREGTNPQLIEERSEQVAMELIGEARSLESYEMGLQPLTDIHLNPEIPLGYGAVSNPQYIYILGVIGLLVLGIACINYATLSIGQSIKRGKEVGLRKVMGAVRFDLVGQYLAESMILVTMAMLVSVVIAFALIPGFNAITNSTLVYTFQWWHLGVFLVAVLIIGMLAGIYPSAVLSRLQILDNLHGRSTVGSSHALRKGMVVFQLLITVFLISSTLIMQRQLNFLQEEDLGYSYQSAISVDLFATPGEDTSFVSRHQSALRNGQLLQRALEENPAVSNVAMASHNFGSNGWANLVATEEDGTYWRFRLLLADARFIEAFGIQMLEGRNFELDNLSDERQGIILNQAAVELFGLENPIGKQLPPTNFGDHVVIGVTEDFKYSSLHHTVDPLIIAQNPMPIFMGVTDGDMLDSPIPKLMFSYQGANLLEGQQVLENAWTSVFGDAEMSWAFIDERIKAQYENEARVNRLVSIATVLSIVIAVLGLVGMIILVVNSKVKEIGIRKVMGASTVQVFRLLSRSFVLQLLIAIFFSIPVTLWLMLQWLENFAYRIQIGPGVFVLSGLIALSIVAIVVAYHTVRAIRMNPVESLRTE